MVNNIPSNSSSKSLSSFLNANGNRFWPSYNQQGGLTDTFIGSKKKSHTGMLIGLASLLALAIWKRGKIVDFLKNKFSGKIVDFFKKKKSSTDNSSTRSPRSSSPSSVGASSTRPSKPSKPVSPHAKPTRPSTESVSSTEQSQIGSKVVDRNQFHNYAENGDLESINKLLKNKKIRVDTKNKYGNTALHIAAENGRTKIVKALLNHDAKLDVKGEDEYTPLHAAVYGNKAEIVQLLLNKGANVDAKNESGQTPLDLANSRKNEEIAEILKKAKHPSDASTRRRSVSSPIEVNLHPTVEERVDQFMGIIKQTEPDQEDGILRRKLTEGFSNVNQLEESHKHQVEPMLSPYMDPGQSLQNADHIKSAINKAPQVIREKILQLDSELISNSNKIMAPILVNLSPETQQVIENRLFEQADRLVQWKTPNQQVYHHNPL